MTEKEYRAQKATGTIDYKKAAARTKSKKVLASIVEDTNDRDTQMVVAMNTHTSISTLTRLIVDSEVSLITKEICIFHPAVTMQVLQKWMERPHVCRMDAARKRLYALQVAADVPPSDRIITSLQSEGFEAPEDPVPWNKLTPKIPGIDPTSPFGEVTWYTSTSEDTSGGTTRKSTDPKSKKSLGPPIQSLPNKNADILPDFIYRDFENFLGKDKK